MNPAVQTQGPHGARFAVRHLRPTDLVALAAFEAKDLPNEARTRESLERDRKRILAVSTVFEQWIAAEDRQTLVVASGLALRGMVSARHRTGRSAWEVDWLVVDGSEADDPAALALLERLCEEAVKARVQRIFLRVTKESVKTHAAVRAGFTSYGSETLLRRGPSDTVAASTMPRAVQLRPKQKDDDLALFRLYHSAVPAQVRSMEGMTLEEWAANRDVQFGQHKEYIWCQEDRLRAWLQVNRGNGCGQFRLLVQPEEESHLEDLVAQALLQLPRKDPVLALVPHYQPSLRTLLMEVWGFEEVAEYDNLARQLAVRVPEARFVPARA